MADVSNHPVENRDLPPMPVDAVAQVIVSDNKLNAYLHIKPPENGGEEASLDDLQAELAKYNISFGIIQSVLEQIAKKPDYNKNIMIAQGIAPIDGTDGTYELLFEKSKDSKPKERADGTVDFRDLDLIENVKQGQALCSITLPTMGTNGTSVFGEPLRAKNGKAVPAMLGRNTKLSEDGTQIYAAINGHVDFTAGQINVNDTLLIRGDVDSSTGNIKTVSSVVITGTVFSGFSVESAGNIQAGGAFSGSSITAGGNIVLKSGSTGCKLKCDGDLTTRFIENCDAFVKGCIKSDYIINSTVKCAKSITVSGPIAKIVGGSCIAGENITARIIGSPSGMKTYLEIGTDSTMISRQQELIKLIPEWEAKISSLGSLINLLQQYEAANRLTPDKEQALNNAVYSYQTYSFSLQNGKQELEEIAESIKLRGYGRVICSGTIFPGTTVKIGVHRTTVQSPLTNRSLYYTEDGIAETFAK